MGWSRVLLSDLSAPEGGLSLTRICRRVLAIFGKLIQEELLFKKKTAVKRRENVDVKGAGGEGVMIQSSKSWTVKHVANTLTEEEKG